MALVGLAPVPAHASGLGPWAAHLPWERLARAEAGTWAEYSMISEERAVGPWLRFLSLGPGPEGGHWVEIWISQRPGSGTQAFRLLLRGDPSQPGSVIRASARLMGGPAQEIRVELLQGDLSTATQPPMTGTSTTMEAPVQTEAGTFRSQLVELRSGTEVVRSWFAEAVPLFGLVRLQLPSGVGLELQGMGRDGVPMIEIPSTVQPEPRSAP